jgi:hypothetical protein
MSISSQLRVDFISAARRGAKPQRTRRSWTNRGETAVQVSSIGDICIIRHCNFLTPASWRRGASAIANGIAQILLRTEDKLAEGRTAQAKAIFEGLQKGTIDRSLTLRIERNLLHR